MVLKIGAPFVSEERGNRDQNGPKTGEKSGLAELTVAVQIKVPQKRAQFSCAAESSPCAARWRTILYQYGMPGVKAPRAVAPVLEASVLGPCMASGSMASPGSQSIARPRQVIGRDGRG